MIDYANSHRNKGKFYRSENSPNFSIGHELAARGPKRHAQGNDPRPCGGEARVAQHVTPWNRRPGDRFSPLGLGGQKKLQDFFVDRKVARVERDRVPLVVDAEDRIVWVAGHCIDEAFRVTNPAQAVIILRLKGLGGSA